MQPMAIHWEMGTWEKCGGFTVAQESSPQTADCADGPENITKLCHQGMGTEITGKGQMPEEETAQRDSGRDSGVQSLSGWMFVSGLNPQSPWEPASQALPVWSRWMDGYVDG